MPRENPVQQQSVISHLEDDLESNRHQIEKLKADLTRSRESYVRRERAYKTRIDELEDELQRLKSTKTQWMAADDKLSSIKGMHTAIQSNVDLVQERTTKILQEQERDLLRAFRARLFDVQTELEKEKSRTDDGAMKWIDKTKQMEKQMDWYKDNADRLDARNQTLTKESERLKSQFQTQEEDRNFLVRRPFLLWRR